MTETQRRVLPFLCLAGYMIIMSVITFLAYRKDKKLAKQNKWRTKEATLLTLGLAGGAAGAILGMRTFRHKTKHWYFWAVNIFAILLHILLFVILYRNL